MCVSLHCEEGAPPSVSSSLILYLAVKSGLVNFEGETVLQRCVLIYVEPRAIRTGLSLLAVVDDPLVVVVVLRVVHALYVALNLGEQLVTDMDVTVG